MFHYAPFILLVRCERIGVSAYAFDAIQSVHVDKGVFAVNNPAFIVDRNRLNEIQIVVLITYIIELTDQGFRQEKSCNDL